MCLVKTLLGQISWDKNLVKEKEYIILQYVISCLIINLAKKIQWGQKMVLNKERGRDVGKGN